MNRHAWATASDGAKTVKIFQIAIKRVEKAHPVLTGVLNQSVLNDRLCLALLYQHCVSSPSPCMYQLSARLPTWTGCELHRMLAAMECTHVPPENLLGISQCIPNCTRLAVNTYVDMFALLPHLISMWACVIDRMPSGLHWSNSTMSINHERSMHTEANHVPARGQHILSFCSFHVSCERCTLSRVESLSELLQVFKASRWSDAHTSSNLCAFAHRRRASKLTLASAAVCLFHCSAAMRWTALD